MPVVYYWGCYRCVYWFAHTAGKSLCFTDTLISLKNHINVFLCSTYKKMLCYSPNVSRVHIWAKSHSYYVSVTAYSARTSTEKWGMRKLHKNMQHHIIFLHLKVLLHCLHFALFTSSYRVICNLLLISRNWGSKGLGKNGQMLNAFSHEKKE